MNFNYAITEINYLTETAYSVLTRNYISNMKTLKIMLIKLTLVTLLWLLAGNVFAHPGGHYHKGDVLNSWTLTNGQIVMGNFSKGYGDQLVLEQLGGKLIYVSV